MIAILIAKWVADTIETRGIYEIAIKLSGHPFLDLNHAMKVVRGRQELVENLILSKATMNEIILDVPDGISVSRRVLDHKLDRSKQEGIPDGGLVLVHNGMLHGYITETDLDLGLNSLGETRDPTSQVRILGHHEEGDNDISMYVDREPPKIFATAPLEYALEIFGKLGISYLCVLEQGSGKLVGVSNASLSIVSSLNCF